MSRSNGRELVAAQVLLLTWLWSGVPRAGLAASPLLADRSERELRALVAEYEALAQEAVAAGVEGAVNLYRFNYVACERSSHRIYENRILRVLDDRGVGAADVVITVGRGKRIRAAKAWMLRADGTFEFIAEQNIHRREAEAIGTGSVIIAFPHVHPLDTLGWSVALESEEAFTFGIAWLLDRFPTKHMTFQLRSDGWVGYRVLGRNLRKDDFTVEVLAREHGAASDFRFTFRELPQVPSEATMMLPRGRREPHVEVAYRGRFDAEYKRWFYHESWPQVALYAEQWLSEVVDSGDEVARHATRLTAGLATEVERADALYRFVRDEIVGLEVDEITGRGRSMREILRDRTAGGWEKGLLLASLLKAAGVTHRLIWARSTTLGPLDSGNPSLWQFPALLVALPTDPERLYDATCDVCPAGIVPHALRGAPTFSIGNQLEDKDEALWKQVFLEVGDVEHLLLDRYLERVRQQRWFTLGETAVDSVTPGATNLESVAIDQSSGGAILEVTSSGLLGLCGEARRVTDLEQLLKDYVAQRFEGANVEPLRDGGQIGAEGDETAVSLRGVLPGLEVPAAEGDSWILPAAMVFGTSFFADWSGPERPEFHVAAPCSWTRRWKAALPPGWRGVKRPAPVRIHGPTLSYELEVHQEDSSLVVERRLVLPAGTTHDLHMLDQMIERIHQLESDPLVVRAAEAGAP